MDIQRQAQSLGELFSTLANQTSALVRQEVDLARTEMTQKVIRLGRDAGMIGAGAVVALGGALALLATLIIVLDIWLPLWLSALIVGLALALIGYVLIQQGLRALKRVDLTPHETLATLRDDATWAKEQTK